MATKIQLRRDLSSNWASTNPILAQGEPGVELDTNNIKIGDGTTAWNSLPYTVSEGGLTSVFVSVDDYYSTMPRISDNGIDWTAEVDVAGEGVRHASNWGNNGVAIGNGVIVYMGYNGISSKDELRYAKNPYQNPIQPTSDLTRTGPNGEEINWNDVSFGGGYFVACGWYYDGNRNNYRYPIAAYSADGENWTKITIDLDYVQGLIEAQNAAHSNTVGGMELRSGVRGPNGWLFSLNYNWDNSNTNDRIAPGAFYITDITTALNSNSYFATFPGSRWTSFNDGHGWLTWTNYGLIYRNTNADPRQGSWTDIDFNNIFDNTNIAYNNTWGIDDIVSGELSGTNYMAISDYYGVVYYSADSGQNWNYVTPGPAYSGVYQIWQDTNGGIRKSWGDNPQSDWDGEKITITGSWVANLNGTFWMDDYDGTSYPLYSDSNKNNRVDTSTWDQLGSLSKYVNYASKGDTTLIVSDTTNVMVGQRVFGHNAVRAIEDLYSEFAEANIVTAVDADANLVTLKYPILQNINNSYISFQPLITYTHGDNIWKMQYGGGKIIGFGDNTDRAYVTTNMTDWRHSLKGQYAGGISDTAYGALDINTNALRNNSETIPGITNALTLGDTFNVYVSGLTDAESGPYDYYGLTDYNEGWITVSPSDSRWYMGVYDNARNYEVAIYSTTNSQYGNNNNTAEDYYHAHNVAIETANHMFWFDDYYGHFMADKIAIGSSNGGYNNNEDYYGYNHIDDVHFDGTDLYVSDDENFDIFAYSTGSNGRVLVHWDDRSRVQMDQYGVTISKDTYSWTFNNDHDGVLYAPYSSDIDIDGYWTIGQGNNSRGYPYIGATNNIGSDAYDFFIQAGVDSGKNYWYFNRNGDMQLPVSSNIAVDGFWLIGNANAKIETDDITDADPYDIVITADGYSWQFLQTGVLKLPAGGDIQDSNGNSVLNKDMPQQLTGDNNYTLQLTDRGGHIYVNYTGHTVYVPTNASVAFPIGTCITLVTATSCPATLTCTDTGTTTLVLSKLGVDNTISIPADTYVTILKIETDKWIVQT